MFSPTVSRHHAAVSRTNVPHRRGVDASRHACTTPVLFEKAHETRCFPRSPCWRTRTVRHAATHVARVVGMSAKVYGDCRAGKSVVVWIRGEGQVDHGGRSIIKKKKSP